ncbi:hypothetical protein RSOLAG1IB_11668 [Rhizoctonia solani AG-1 IB]|uniref:Uncharacterized protein n=1 Tax=Thanatephorus cucumeris (strain AG1-IB / isolate 7/3/14) TaxID=1108050 RepID=M5C5C7_THACB|nr:hypothetical protein BN14_08380 [Rhizoctonia solani AG-1 IB]CEL54422.1 hypothetical protein RSOLAG1IB_11668 [Rhizoctonia solani AG-1 IB]
MPGTRRSGATALNADPVLEDVDLPDFQVQYLNNARVRVTYTNPDRPPKTWSIISKPKNTSECKLEREMMCGAGFDESHDTYLNIRAATRCDLNALTGGRAILYSELTDLNQHTILTSVQSEYEYLFRFPGNWAGREMLRRICRNKRDTIANKSDRVKGTCRGCRGGCGGRCSSAGGLGSNSNANSDRVDNELQADEEPAEDKPPVDNNPTDDNKTPDNNEPPADDNAPDNDETPADDEPPADDEAVDDEPPADDGAADYRDALFTENQVPEPSSMAEKELDNETLSPGNEELSPSNLPQAKCILKDAYAPAHQPRLAQGNKMASISRVLGSKATTFTVAPSSIPKATARATRPNSSLKTLAAAPVLALNSIAPAAAARPSPKRAPPPLPKSSIVTSNSAETTPLAVATASIPAANKAGTTELNVTKPGSNTIKTGATRPTTARAKEVTTNKPPRLPAKPKSAKSLALVSINPSTLAAKRRIQDPPAGALAPIQKRTKAEVPNQANSDAWAEELSKELKGL